MGGAGRPGEPTGRAEAAQVAQVIVGLPLRSVFSYAVPAELSGRLSPGQRVRVPFRGRPRVGIVVGLAPPEPSAELEPVEAMLDPAPALSGPLLALGRWAAEETASAWGETLIRAVPPPARVVGPSTLPPDPPSRPPQAHRVAYGAHRGRVVEAAVLRTLAAGHGVLLVAPEIEAAHRWAERLELLTRLPAAVITSGESPRRRWEAWWALRRGTARLAVGTRVAAFAPVAPLGMAIVLDEHDPAHKAPEAPRWHARELLVRRAALEGGGCLVASAAPSLESWVRVRTREATDEQAEGDHWPTVHRVDLRHTDMGTCLSPGLREGVREALAGGQSAVLVVNRLGYGRALGCAECGAVRRCPRCRVALIYHRLARSLECRFCGVRQRAQSLCGRCRGRRLLALGWGTERLEAEARAAFPGVAVGRYDGAVDATAAAATREAFRGGHVRVLVGTQMTLRLLTEAPVGVAALVLADTMLGLPDFRAAELTFRIGWSLAEGVAPGGSLWLQSFYPDHPALAAVALGVREHFYEREWAERRELGYPPARRLARLVAEGRDAQGAARRLAARCVEAGLSVLGPTVLRGSRVQLLLQGGSELPGALAAVLEPQRGHRRLGAARLVVDVDPVELL